MSVIDILKRFGITTGATAAAAAKAATIMLIENARVNKVVIPTPVGLRIEIPIDEVNKTVTKEDGKEVEEACAKATKFSGDNPDVLNNIEIISCAYKNQSNEIKVIGDEGVGKITRPGLRETNGYAISPTAAEMIINAVKEVTLQGITVKIRVPKGEEISKFTMNPLIGINGGISILGTIGIEMPVSDEDFIAHVKAELCFLKNKTNKIALAFGNTSFDIAKKLGYETIKIGDRVGDSIEAAIKEGFSEIILVGLPGKMTKVAAGIFNTHHSYGDARIETITHASIIAQIEFNKVIKIANSKTVSEALSYLNLEERKKVMKVIANRILERLNSRWNAKFKVLIFDEKGQELA
ncbi:cobalamin biosynthesis protein CbiD [Acidianus sulfidivorans JP7]|uniref:Cobalt-precorrin-5B C(1)-methyltransferase n=1 Tax=Acidianus sulfidivorans JP7 TaxID=619593 RepID=A0A2U9IJS9_9CREN|nr:cobalt-precorrin-5B (C(1))-methyltransferase CbiD [Acidianus sulfidivorans]AWR96298.1 cobalamin biosynthesis protein CbiD [Acidianus sulfidivorans JP7]